jgi:hypothetical protein
MARKKEKIDTSTVLFDVFYEDGSRASNRKVPAMELAGPGGDDAALTVVMDQDRRIAELSGKPPRPIKRVVRSGR